MSRTRRVSVLFGVLALTALAVGPAFATELNAGQAPTTAAEWTAAHPEDSAADCVGDEVPASGSALWHFILTSAPSGETITLTASFTDENDVAVPDLTDVGDEADHSGTYHFYILTPDDYTLQGAETDVNGNILNLSHVCIGEPGTDVPESPASALLVLTAGLLGLFFVRRQVMSGKATAA